jgi:hypothetical protein
MIALALLARVAAANPAAEKLFEDGRAALALGHLDEACDAFRRSQELEPRVGTLLNLGDCEEKRKRIASAWEAFVEAKALAASLKDSKRAATADKHAAALVTRLPYLVLAVKRVDGLVITRDGVAVPTAEWDHEVPLDPKHYKLEASAPGRTPWTRELDLAEAQHLKIEVPELATVAVAVVDKPVDKPVDQPNDGNPGQVRVPYTPPPKPILPFTYRLGVGAFMGLSNRNEVLFGVRAIANAAPLGPGWIRAVPVFRRWSGVFPDDPVYRTYTTNSFGATLEYVAPVNDWILIAAGAGLAVELQKDANMNSNTYYVPAVRVSPTLHYERFDISVSYELGHGPATMMPDMFADFDRPAEWTHRFEAALDFLVW